MRTSIIKLAGVSGFTLLSACASPELTAQYSSQRAGFASVSERTNALTGQDAVWIQNAAEAKANAERVHSLVHQKTINADTAVQVAILNNKGLQASYAELGLTAADLWQQTLQPNPTVSIGILGIGADGLGGYRSVEATIANNLLSLFTRGNRAGINEIRFLQAQQRAALETLRVAGEARNAWINAVAAFEAGGLIRQAQETANASSELAARLGETGALNIAGQAREHVFYAELTGQRAQATLAARLAKEALTRQLGLWGTEVDYYVPNALPALPRSVARRQNIEAEAIKNRIDLSIARLELEAVAKEQGLTEATRFVTDLEIIFGVESERELDAGDRVTETTPQVELEFDIPIFDSGKARLRRAEMTYMRAANLLAQNAVNVRSEARSAYLAYTSTHQIAQHYRDAVLPLRRTIEEEALLSYNGMITNTFELLADTRARLNSNITEASARRDFWSANANLAAAVYGGGGSTSVGGTATGNDVAGGSGAGH